MSRSYNEHHKISRTEKQPSPYRDNEGKQDRHRKMRAYGSKGYCGFGGETYVKKWHEEVLLDIINKRKARRDAKKLIQHELENEI